MNKKIVVKLSHPQNWFRHGHYSYANHFPGLAGVWGDFKFEINNEDITECDVWVVHESLDKIETVKCPPQNCILVVSEEQQQVPNYNPAYLSQFALIVTSRGDLIHSNILRTFNLNPWRVNQTYDQIEQSQSQKTSTFSAVISNNVSTDGHLKRYAFVNKLKGHFKDRLTWYGKGENDVKDKWQALNSYRYSLAMENCAVPYYFTEKIMDCYCASTMPIYWGCQNILNYFPAESMVLINDVDYKEAIDQIENAFEEKLYEQNYDAIIQAKNLVLNKYQFIPAIVDIINRRLNLSELAKQRVMIKPKYLYETESKMRTLIKKMINKFV